MDTLIPIRSAFCPVCNVDIRKEVTYKRNQFVIKQKRFLTATQAVMERSDQQVVFTKKEKDAVTEYFAGTKVSKLTITCPNRHKVGFRVNDKTSELLEIIAPSETEQQQQPTETEVTVTTPVPFVSEIPTQKVDQPTSSFGVTFTPEQEESWLFVCRHP